ncbi:hypothetical protein M0802_014406 [Mischocyttarus mexicanus]|nr:hypothetical protein M0802_014406 [Mischocyttarus mexicanus]
MGQGEVERKKLLDQIRELQVHVAQLIQVQPKPNKVPSARIPESESRLPLPQPNATLREFPHDQLCIPKEITEQIPKFDGYNISARDFIKSCENATTKLVRYSIQDIIQTFKSRLMGSAYRLFIGVEFHTIEEFLEAVKKTFSPRKTANQYIGEIGNLRQNPNETVMQYACRTRELETALIDSIKTEFPENSAQIINKVETDLLKGFTDGITTSIRTELRLNGNKTLTDVIADAIALENKTTPNPPNPSYNRNNNNRNSNGRHFNCYQNLQPRFFPEERRDYSQHNYRNQRSEDYENNKTYNTYENSKLKNVGNAFSPLAYYETDRFDTRTDTHPTGSRTAQITRPEAGTELTYAIQQETPLCKLSNTTNSKVFSYNVLPFEPVKFVSGGFLTDPKPRITSYVRVLNPEIPKILLKEQELTPKAYSNDAKNAVTMTSSAFSLQQVIIVEEVINVEDIINVENIEEVKNVEDIVSVEEVINVEDIIVVEEINDRRININKEVNIEEIDSREINKEVKLRKEKLNGKEINQNNFERKVGELGDGQATSDVDSHTRKPALEGKILEIIKCKEFMAAKPNEATSDVDKSEKIGEKKEFLCSVKRTFAAKKTLVHYFGDLNQLRQNPNETVMQYACRTRELETALIDSIKTEFPENSAQIINKVETDLLKDAIADAIALENKTTPNPPNPSYNRNNNNRNSNGRYEERYTDTENRTYRFNYNQDRRYPDQPPRYTDRNNDNYNQHRSIMYNDQKYPNANNRNLNRDYNQDIRHFNCYQNLQPRFFPEKRRNYRQHNYRNQRSENYENNKTYNTYENSKLKNVGNAFSPLAYYETDRFDTRTDTHPTGSRTAQITRPEAGTELTYAIQQETPLCKLSNTTNSKVFSYNVLPFEPVKFVSGGFLTDPKPRISSYVRVLNPEIPKILLKKQELTPKAYSNDAKNAVTMTSSAFSLQYIINVENIEEVKNVEDIVSVEEVINVEDIIDVEEINDRRININKEVNIEEIDSREINKEVKLRKEKLNGKEINQNNFERKVGELGDGQATSEVDSHTRKLALEGKILEIIKCKEFMAVKPNEATSDVDKSEKIGEKSFNEERNETNQVLKKIDKEFDIQHNPQELDNLFHENNSEGGVKMHNQNFYSEVVLKSLIISKDRLIEYNSGIKYKFGKATVNADTGFGNSIALCKPMAL